jgi:hypothetical protein
MAQTEDDIALDDRQQEVFDEACLAIDGTEDSIEIMTRTQDLVNLLLRRSEDSMLREHTLGEISRFCLGVIKAQDLSQEYRIRRLRMFSKASLRMLIAKRPRTTRAGQQPGTPPPALRRASDRPDNPG